MSRGGSSGIKGRPDLAAVGSGVGEFLEEHHQSLFGIQDSAIPSAALVIGGRWPTGRGVDARLEFFHRRGQR